MRTGFFIALTGFIVTLFLEATLLPTLRLYAVFFQNPLLGAALICLWGTPDALPLDKQTPSSASTPPWTIRRRSTWRLP